MTNHTHEGGYIKTCCDHCFDAFTGCKNNNCPCHIPQTKETESVDAIVEAIVDISHDYYASDTEEDHEEYKEAIREKLLSLQAQNQAKIDDAVEKEVLLVLRGIQHKWMSDGEVKTLEDIDARIKALTPKNI